MVRWLCFGHLKRITFLSKENIVDGLAVHCSQDSTPLGRFETVIPPPIEYVVIYFCKEHKSDSTRFK